MGDKSGHSFHGNQYTVSGYNTSWGQKFRVHDPLGNEVTKNISSESSAWSIAHAMHQRAQRGEVDIALPNYLHGDPEAEAKLADRMTAVRMVLKHIPEVTAIESGASPEVLQENVRAKESYQHLAGIYAKADTERKAAAESASHADTLVPKELQHKRISGIGGYAKATRKGVSAPSRLETFVDKDGNLQQRDRTSKVQKS